MTISQIILLLELFSDRQAKVSATYNNDLKVLYTSGLIIQFDKNWRVTAKGTRYVEAVRNVVNLADVSFDLPKF